VQCCVTNNSGQRITLSRTPLVTDGAPVAYQRSRHAMGTARPRACTPVCRRSFIGWAG
jgi:hypothetical protein